MAQLGLTEDLERGADYTVYFASRGVTRVYGHFFPPVAVEQPTPEFFNDDVNSEDEG